MLISHRKKFIYVKTIKTAGTSVEEYFQRYCYAPNELVPKGHQVDFHEDQYGIVAARVSGEQHDYWKNHLSAEKIKMQLGKKVYKNYFKFSVVRNPWDKVVSFYYYKQSDPLFKMKMEGLSFELFVQQYVNISLDWTLYTEKVWWKKREPCLDYYIRYESLQEGLKEVCYRLGIPFESERLKTFKSRPRVLSGTRKPFQEYYSKEARDIVANVYKNEIEYFEYKFD